MDRKRRYIGLTLLIALCSIMGGWAQEFKLKMDCPVTAEAGQSIKIVYKIEAPVRDFKAESKTAFSIKGADVQGGPYTSTSSTTSVTNGKTSHSKTISYTYVVCCNIRMEEVVVEPMKYDVLMGDSVVAHLDTPAKVIHLVRGGVPQETEGGDSIVVESSYAVKKIQTEDDIEEGDIVISWSVDKPVAHLGDTLVCMCDLYSQVNPTRFTEIGQCLMHDCVVLKDTISTVSLDEVEYRGRQYKHARILTAKVVPLRIGTFTIGGEGYELELEKKMKGGSIFDIFFSHFRYKVHSETVSFRIDGVADMRKGETETGEECFLICDVSGSMDMLDIEPTRKGCVEDFANAWLAEMPESGIVTFAGGVEQYYPAKTGLRGMRFVDETKKDGTAIGDAMVTPIACGSKVKDLIVITDGANNMGYLSLETAFKIMNRYNVRVSYVYLNSGNDSVQYIPKGLQSEATIANMRVPEKELQQIKKMVENTGGVFGMASDRNELMRYLTQLKSLVESRQGANKSFCVLDEKMLQKMLREWEY